jgi:subtilisin family serine protease
VGSLRLTDGRRNVGPALPLRVIVVAATADVIPVAPADPASDRITSSTDGFSVVRDELVIGVSWDVADPDEVAHQVASSLGGVFIGSVPKLRLYQIRFLGSTPEELVELAAQAEAVPGVGFASLNYLNLDVETVIPDDSEWDSWGVKPEGNNWGLEWIDAPGAWDTTTGGENVGVAVIDLGNDDRHSDLDDNVTRADGNDGQTHGTHVAGILCAEGNNGNGVTGVAWDCDLRFYAASLSTAVTAALMAEAVDDGARVVNMSLNYIENGNTEIDEAALVGPAADANDVLGQAVIYGDRIGANVLWVVAAGNDYGRDALYTAPGGLGARFPTNTITVAAIDEKGNLADFSNGGEYVSVAAPGEFIWSTLKRTCEGWAICRDNYGYKSGTSMATPHVAGLATLVIANDPNRTAADVKACIVAGARQAGTTVAGEDFHTINARAAVECDVLELPARVDIVLAFDLTGSMGSVLQQAKEEADDIIEALAAAAPLTDFRYGLVSYEDYVGVFDSRPCGSTYVGPYGEGNDSPFRLNSSLSANPTTLVTAVQGLALGSGFDFPEPYGRVFWELAQADTGAQVGWRPGALRLIVNFADGVPHDTNINQDVDGGTFLPFDTGIDPGRNATIECGGGDDIDFQDDALAALDAQDIHLLQVDSSDDDELEPYWRHWTSLTGGSYQLLSGGRALSDVLIELISLI